MILLSYQNFYLSLQKHYWLNYEKDNDPDGIAALCRSGQCNSTRA